MSWSAIVKGAAIVGVIAASLLVAAVGRSAEPEGVIQLAPGIAHADVRIRVIHARPGKKHIDAHLDDLKKTLEKYKYDNYSLVIDDTMHLPVAGTQSIGVLSGKSLKVTLVAVTPEKATIRLILDGEAGQTVDTTVAGGSDKPFFLAGPRYDEGVLMLAIEPHYDPNNLPVMGVGSNNDGKKHE